MKKLNNWLLFGLSNSDIMGSSHSSIYEDSFFVVSRDGLQAFVTSQAYKDFSNKSTLVTNCNTYCLTKADENDADKYEVIKISKFYEMVFDKKAVGMPARETTGFKQGTKHVDFENEIQMIEKWPIVQAYGLDIVGNGFFTMKHNFKNIKNELDHLYSEFDSFSKYRIVNEEIERLGITFFDNFYNFNKDTIQKRQQRREFHLIEAFHQKF